MRRFGFVLLAMFAAFGCGGAGPQGQGAAGPDQDRLGPEDLEPRATLVKAELATRVDEERMRPVSTPATEFAPETPAIHLVARLKDVPPAASITVQWFRDAEPQPILESRADASDRYQFIASLERTEERFAPGPYHVRILVNGRETATVPFEVTGGEKLAAGLQASGIAVSERVDRKMRPQGAHGHLKHGTREIRVSFDVAAATPEAYVTVHWLRGDETMLEQDLETPSDRRYVVSFDVAEGIPDGAYTIQIESQNEILDSAEFQVGKVQVGSSIDTVALGLALGPEKMPQKPMTAFPRDTRVIQCGVRFLGLEPGSVVEVQWTRVDDEGDMLIYTTRSDVSSGGSGTMGAAWEPVSELQPGNYKAVVVVNGQVMAEARFIVE